MPKHLNHPLLSLSTWKTHLVFWLGAIFVGLASVALTVGSEYMTVLFRELHQ